MDELLKELEGLEVVEVHIGEDGSFAILFDDGYIMYASADNEVSLVAGRGWEATWEALVK